MEDKIGIYSLTPQMLKSFIQELSEPSYRTGQIFRWLSSGVTDFSEMTDLSKTLRCKLYEKCFIEDPKILNKQISSDGTIKYLLEFSDGSTVETVVMRYIHGNSICLSTQTGCKMGCVFCASFNPVRSRNLTAGEILWEILAARKDSGLDISNIVLMGIGEPLDNFDNVMDFLNIVSAPGGLNIGMRHISLSTCGIVPQIDKLAENNLQLTLSVSLHAPNNELRSKIMPVNRRYPLEELMGACKRYFSKTHRRISFEYAMIKKVNDSLNCADQLAGLLSGMNCHVNLIPLNRHSGSTLLPSDPKTVASFRDALENKGINVTVRRRLGSDIDAACGQLKAKNKLQ